MTAPAGVPLVVVGSVGLDTIETPRDRREDILGGSASYACAAASFFTDVGMVGVVGADFPDPYRACYERFGIDLSGLQSVDGETFRWSGVYESNMDNRRTLSTELNVFADFAPELPDPYRGSDYLFLANIGPDLQLRVLDQVSRPRFVVADTMDLWITTARDALTEVVRRVHLLTLNESEARLLSGEHNLVKAAYALLSLGPRHVLVKKGEHGSILFSGGGPFLIPAYPLEDVTDPTGAGDTFAGGFMGALAEAGDLSESGLRKAMAYGSVVASFGVEAFGLDRLQQIGRDHIEERLAFFREMTRMP